MINIDNVFSYTGRVFGDALHLSRLKSIAVAVVATLRADTLAIAAIGRALSIVNGIKAKHGIKQIDRLLSNDGISLERTFFPKWVRFLIAARREIAVALDWTDFDKDKHTTLAIHLITRHGRASALVWKTFNKKDLKGNRNDFEDEVLMLLKRSLPDGIKVTVLADRGFADVKLFAFLKKLGFDYIIRIKSNTAVSSIDEGEKKIKPARAWLLPDGETTMLVDVGLTRQEHSLPAFVCVQEKGMKSAWYLGVSDKTLTAAKAIKLYGRRFSIEETFRDIKNARFGMGLSNVRISSPKRRDRLLLICAIASTLLTLLGAAGESIGMDRYMKANTKKTRTHSLLSQGAFYYACIPTMPEEDLIKLLNKYRELLSQHEVFLDIFGLI